MPRYFFHRTDGHFERDEDGLELADIQSARDQAIIYAGESLKFAPNLVYGHDLRVEVTDGNYLLLFSIDITTSEAPKPGPTTS